VFGVLVYAASSDDRVQGDDDNLFARASSRHPVHLAASIPNAPTDAELVERLRHDDRHALEELARRYLPRLGTIAYAILGSSDLAQDVVQETLIALWDQRTRLDPANVAAYLSRMTRNRALNMRRHESIEARTVQQFSVTANAAPQVVSNTAEAKLGAADVMAQVHMALRHVPPGPRETFLLAWQNGLTYAEIAATLGIAVATVRQHMHRATQRVAQHLLKSERD
jgi:RNA polymerase sigma factor (sigma-70 family)